MSKTKETELKEEIETCTHKDIKWIITDGDWAFKCLSCERIWKTKESLKKDLRNLNLGSGEDYKDGYINLDIEDFYPYRKCDVVWDLDVFPYPFKNNYFNDVLANHIIEHLNYPIQFLEEVWRISKPDAEIIISVPHFSHYINYCDLTHKRVCSSALFWNYEVGKPFYYSKFANFEVLDKRFTITRTNYKFLNVFNFVLNLSVIFTELFLCKIIPVSQIIFKLKVIKEKK